MPAWLLNVDFVHFYIHFGDKFVCWLHHFFPVQIDMLRAFIASFQRRMSFRRMWGLLVETQELLLDASVPKSSQYRRNGPVCILQLAIEPLIGSLMAFLPQYIFMQLFTDHLLLLLVELMVRLQSLFALVLFVEQLLPFVRDVGEVLDYGVFAVQKHDQHGHCFDVLL